MIQAHRKLIAALVGIGLLLLHRRLGLDLSGQEAALVDIVISALTAAGVYGFKNEEMA